jgi:6,7-dimethyl-8-ribityllumazine synthase
VNRDIDESSENVLSEWSRRVAGDAPDAESDPPRLDFEPDLSAAAPEEGLVADEPDQPETPAWGSVGTVPGPGDAEEDAEEDPGADVAEAVVAEPEIEEPPGEPASPVEPALEDEPAPAEVAAREHAAGGLMIPDGYAILEGEATGGRRAVGVVVSRFNGEVTTRLLERALEELEEADVARDAITVLVGPVALERPRGATALAKTRRFACIVALGCVIRGETPHFDYVAGEAASGLQLAALETGVPVSFGVLTLETADQADARIEKGAEAVRTALEMADVFAQLRAAASR